MRSAVDRSQFDRAPAVRLPRVARSIVVLLAVLVSGLCELVPAQQNRPNVLLIAVDDLRPELVAFGARSGVMSHVDAFAARSTIFTRHYVQVPTCGASRYAFLTGRSAHRSRAMGNEACFRGPTAIPQLDRNIANENVANQRAPRPAWTMPELFRQNGYRTTQIGKVSHTPDGRVYAYDGSGNGRDELPGSWDELATPYGPWKRGWGIFFAYADGKHREDGEGHRDLMEFVAEKDEDLPDGLLAQQAVRTIEESAPKGAPFFLAVGFYKPHLPFVATKADLEAIENNDKVEDAEDPAKSASHWFHASREFFRYANDFSNERPLPEGDRMSARRAYLACVRFVDRQIGKVLGALDRSGLADNTIVVFWSDHGWHLGDSGIWGKHTPFERALHSPLLVRVPASLKIDAPRSVDRLVSSLDVYPTLVELCNLERRATANPLDGRSLVPLLRGEREVPWRPAVFGYWNGAITVRDETHRLIFRRAKDGALRDVELYDVRSGPDPTVDLAASEPAIVERLLAYADGR
ncbi:MAG: sulfatase [Planctomycetes bacterium]|nr:sulfatase [Planctomycetota bacterium]MCB9918256.1 sulfatase [Planctomycetota bacterium]